MRANGRVITVTEAVSIGISRAAQARLVRDERLRRPMRGVLVDDASPPSPELAIRIAVRAAGEGACASHGSAAWLLGLVPRPPGAPHVMVPRRRRVRLPGVVVHQSDDVGERVVRDGLSLTSASRTLLELAADLPEDQLCAAIDRALTDLLTAVPKLVEVATDPRRRHHPGASQLLATLQSRGFLAAPDQSALERRLAEVLAALQAREGLAPPAREVAVDGGRFRLDFAWPRLKLAVEGDGYAWHWSPDHKDRDAQRHNDLSGLGWTVLVFTWRQVVSDPVLVAETILANYRRAEAAAAAAAAQ